MVICFLGLGSFFFVSYRPPNCSPAIGAEYASRTHPPRSALPYGYRSGSFTGRPSSEHMAQNASADAALFSTTGHTDCDDYAHAPSAVFISL